MNRIFLSGKIQRVPDVAYTPKGRKIVTFPLQVAEGDYAIDVVGAGEALPERPEETVGRMVLVAGELVKARFKSHDVLRVKANKILWMEE